MHFSRFYGVAASWQPCNVTWPKKYETYQKVTLIYVVSQHINTFIIICTRSMYYALWLETWYSYFPWKPLLNQNLPYFVHCCPFLSNIFFSKKYNFRPFKAILDRCWQFLSIFGPFLSIGPHVCSVNKILYLPPEASELDWH